MAGNDKDMEFSTGLDTSGMQKDLDSFVSKNKDRKVRLNVGGTDTKELEQSLEALNKTREALAFDRPKKELQEYIVELKSAKKEFQSLDSVARDLTAITEKALSHKSGGGAIDELSKQVKILDEELQEAGGRVKEVLDGIASVGIQKRADAARDKVERQIVKQEEKELAQIRKQTAAATKAIEKEEYEQRKAFAQEWARIEKEDAAIEKATKKELADLDKARLKSALQDQKEAEKEKIQYLQEEEKWHKEIEAAIRREQAAEAAAVKEAAKKEKAEATAAEKKKEALYGREVAPLSGMGLFFGLMGAKTAVDNLFGAIDDGSSEAVKEFQKVTDSVIEMGQAGSSIGMLFGPEFAAVGAVVGGVVGAVTGYFTYQNEEFEKMDKQIKTLTKGADSLVQKSQLWIETIKAGSYESGALQVQEHYKELGDEIQKISVQEEALKILFKDSAELAGMSVEQYLSSTTDMAVRNDWQQLELDRMKLVKQQGEDLDNSMGILRLKQRADIDETAAKLRHALGEVGEKAGLATVPTAKLTEELEAQKEVARDATDHLESLKSKYLVIVDLLAHGALKLAIDEMRGIKEDAKKDEDSAKAAIDQATDLQAELDRRRHKGASGAKHDLDEIIAAQKQIHDLTWAAAMDATKKRDFHLLPPDAQAEIKKAKEALVSLSTEIDAIAQREGESDKDYFKRMQQASGKAKVEDVKKWIEGEKEKLRGAQASFDAYVKLQDAEEDKEEKKYEYFRRLRQQDIDDEKAYREMMLKMATTSAEQTANAFQEGLKFKNDSDYPNPFFDAKQAMQAKREQADYLEEQYEYRADLQRKQAKDDAERQQIEIQLARDEAKVEEELIDYRSALYDKYSQRFKDALSPMVDLTNDIFSHIEDNITNEKRAFNDLPKAVRASVGGILKEKAKVWIGDAAGEGAAALASLAIGDLKGAGLHGAAAAGYLAAAALAGYAGAKLTPKEEKEPATSKDRAGSKDLKNDFRTREMAPVVVYMTGPGGTLVIPASDPRHLADFGDMVNQATSAAMAAQQG